MLPHPIPDRLPGTVIPQYVRCGKANCGCARGQLHGPYWYRFWREDPYVLHKEYVRKADVEQVRAACEAYAQDVREGRALLRTGRGLMGRIERGGGSALARTNRLSDALAGVYLLDEMDDFFWAKKGSLKQRLDMLRMQDEFYHVVRD